MAIVYTQLSYYGKNRVNNSGLASTWMLSSHTYDLSEHIDALCKQIKRKKKIFIEKIYLLLRTRQMARGNSPFGPLRFTNPMTGLFSDGLLINVLHCSFSVQIMAKQLFSTT